MLELDVRKFQSPIRVALLSTLYLTVSGIIILTLKSIGQYDQNNKSNEAKNHYAKNGHTDFLVMIIELFRFLKGIKLLLESLKSIVQF